MKTLKIKGGSQTKSSSKTRSKSPKSRSKSKSPRSKSKSPRSSPDEFVDFLYPGHRESHFFPQRTRSTYKIGATRTCFAALAILLVSHALTSMEVTKDYANLQKLVVEMIIGSLSTGNSIIMDGKKLAKGSLKSVLEKYIDPYTISVISSLNATFKGRFSEDIVRGTMERILPCRGNTVEQEGTFFNDFPLNIPIPIAITTANGPDSRRMWEVDDWGSLVITCENGKYMIKWYGAYGSDNIQISHGASRSMSLEHFYRHINEDGSFKDIESESFNTFIKNFILRESDYDKVPQSKPLKNYNTRVAEEIDSWVQSSRRGRHFKMIAFTSDGSDVINEIIKVILDDGVIEASKHIKK